MKLLYWLSIALFPAAITSQTPSRSKKKKNIILDTDLFSDVDDTAALLIAATHPSANLLAVTLNHPPSSYSALAASAILGHYGRADVSLGVKSLPLTGEAFLDRYYYRYGEYASKIAYNWADAGGRLKWERGGADAELAVPVYRRALAQAEDASVTIISVGSLDNLSGLLNSTADQLSPLSGRELVRQKVAELVVMGGRYPSGRSFNFWASDPARTAHVLNLWEGGRIVFLGDEVGEGVRSGRQLMEQGPARDPVRMAYVYYTYGRPHPSWDPLTALYAIEGRGAVFEYANRFGYNYIEPDGSNRWIDDESATNQFYLRLATTNESAAAYVDAWLMRGAQLPPTPAAGPAAGSGPEDSTVEINVDLVMNDTMNVQELLYDGSG